MIVPLRPGLRALPHGCIPQRRRVVIIGATEAGVSCAFLLGESVLLVVQHNMQGLTTIQSALAGCTSNYLWRSLTPLTKGETLLGVRATAIHVAERRLEVSTGASFVYDKLASAMPLVDLQRLIADNKPGRLNSAESWCHWLNARDIELMDESTQPLYGDVDGQAAGKRVADSIKRAMAMKYSTRSLLKNRSAGLFHPRIVTAT